jgi:hypothetical protein
MSITGFSGFQKYRYVGEIITFGSKILLMAEAKK